MKKSIKQYKDIRFLKKRSLIFRIFLKFSSLFFTYVVGLFVPRIFAKDEPDTSWETGRASIFSKGINFYVDKIKQLNQCDLNQSVLEVGSGDGQWLVAFTKCAKKIYGIEPGAQTFTRTLDTLKDFKCVDEIEVKQASAEAIPYPNSSMDLIWCVGVFMFTNQKEALSEFNNKLKPGGRLVLTVNGLGYFVMQVLNGIKYRSLKKTTYGLNGIYDTLFKWLTGHQLGTCAVRKKEMLKLFEDADFDLVETRLWLASEDYPLKHLGFATNYVFIATKR